MFEHFPILSVMIWWPILGAVLIVLLGDNYSNYLIKAVALFISIVELILCVPLYRAFNANTPAMQFVENHVWIQEYGVHYALGVDGVSLALLILTAFTTLIVVMAGCSLIKRNLGEYMAAFLVSQGMMAGVFCAMDAVLFYVFWEGMLVPIYLSIGIWGSRNRSYAAIKFFLYTFLGSVLMLVALIYLHTQTDSFEIAKFYDLPLPLSIQVWLFLAFFAAFAVKVPMWPFHTWLPDAHTEAPAGGSVVLAALMLKMGVYGFVRFSMPIAPLASQQLDWLMIGLGLVAIVYIGILAISQSDMKKLIAYSSIAHMGFAVLGCFMVYEIIRVTGRYDEAYMSMEGAVVQMVSHAFSTGALFLAVGIIQYRVGSRIIKDFGGVAKTMPILASFFMLFAMSNVGLPGTSGFVGEFMVILSAFQAHPLIALVAGLTLVIAAAYTLYMYKRVFFGPVVNKEVAALQDIGWFDSLTFGLLSAVVLILGFYPQWILNILHSSIGFLLTDSLKFNVAG
ncbi:MAG: NuoM family protein [Gammaproteobacteria bacterium]